ncbi:TPA: hypothetical protein PXE99_001894 [Mannheimia haemolytica]|nr:hypothetical protein [Mannheimia haemolytica]
MSIKKFNYLLLVIISGLLLLVIIIPNDSDTEITKNISSFLDNYLFGDIGLVSLGRPFMSKVVANYIALSIPTLGVAMYFVRLIDFKQKIPLWAVIILIFLCGLGFYFSYFSNNLLIVPQRLNLKLAPDSIYYYLLAICSILLLCSMSVPYMIFYFKKWLSKK